MYVSRGAYGMAEEDGPDTKRQLLLILGTVALAILVNLGFFSVVFTLTDTPQPDEPFAEVYMEVNHDTNTATLTFGGSNPPIGSPPVTYFVNETTVTHNGESVTWNGDNYRGVVESGSEHIVTGVEPGDTIRVKFRDPDYSEPATISFTVGEEE